VGLLLGLFESACGGQGEIALICGEPGIGKSRTVRALCDQLELPPEQMLVFQCSPHEQTSPLHPWRRPSVT
jgi:predicted ATPase